MDLGVEQLHQGLAVERDDPGQHLVGDGRQRVAVGGRADLVSGDLFRRHVRRSAGSYPRHRLQRRTLKEFGKSEIRQDRSAFIRQQDVGRLDIPMDDAMAVRVIKPGGDPPEVFQGGGQVDRPMRHRVGQAAARDVLDDHVGGALKVAEVVDVDDVGVAELGDRLGLVAEAGDRIDVGCDRLHDLDRAGPLQLRVIGAIDDAHRPLADEILDLVGP